MSSFYKKYIIPITTILFLSLIGCGSGEGKSSTKETTLAEANVAIYKVKDNGSLSLLRQEKTSSGDTLDEIGKFNIHTNELTDDDFYLYKITGGKDWDSDKNGILDENSTINRGILRSIAQGIDIKKAGNNFKISYTTELFYEEIVPTLKRKFDRATFPSILNNKVSAIIEGSNNIQDILTFNPIEDKEKLKTVYKIRTKTIVDDIHQGRIPALNMSAILSSYNEGGQTYGIKLSTDGTKAYVANSQGLEVIDISNPVNPTNISSYRIEGYAEAITLSSDGTKAYVLTNHYVDDIYRLIIIDISNPTNLIQLGYFDMKDESYAITISNDDTKAYIAGGKNGLIVLDISNPINPTQLGFFDIGKDTYGDITYGVTLSKDGTKVYICNGYSGLLVIDISNPTNPTQISSLNTEGKAYAITLSEDATKAYIADGENGLVVVDISNPTNLSKIGYFNTAGEARAITLSNDETKAYVADYKNGLVVVDISNPTTPIQLGSYKGFYTLTITFSNDGTKAYIGNQAKDYFMIIDVSNTKSSPKLGSYGTVENTLDTPPSESGKVNMTRVLGTIQNLSPIINSYGRENSNIFDIELSSDGTKAYLLDNYKLNKENAKGFIVVDISNPNNLTQLGFLDTVVLGTNFSDDTIIDINYWLITSMGYAKNITISNDGTKAYIGNSGLVVLDISNPINPTQLGIFYKWGETNSVAISNDGTKAYIINNNDLIVIDISNPTNPSKIGLINTGNKIYALTLSNDDSKAYLLNDKGDFVVIDISNPTNPIKLGSYNTTSYYIESDVDITISKDGTKAYMIDGFTGLIIFDISDTTNPTQLGSLDIKYRAYSVSLSKDGTKAYIANGENGLLMIDISNPANPTKLGSYSTEGTARKVKLSNDGTKAYVADGENGLVIIDLDLYN